MDFDSAESPKIAVQGSASSMVLESGPFANLHACFVAENDGRGSALASSFRSRAGALGVYPYTLIPYPYWYSMVVVEA
jgi:hypothetical protein